jgi:hypothetical protein
MRPIPMIACSADVFLMRAPTERLAALGCAALELPFDLEELRGMAAAQAEVGLA